MELCITEIVDDGYSIDKEVVWLKCRTSSNNMVAFWGELDGANRNIASLRHQRLPVYLEISAPEDCIPTPWEKSEYKLSVSVPSNVGIYIDPER
ncbi:hypothetical protein HC024_21750 [Methylococcaceae bacterium WWC4]|nr:hypothetical protein [Methylococcaceae bacterium WWC4]